ncbi:DNA-binding protein RHL1 isoform X2 [Jatropha curcas]|uniref:DNA-binding protein RHL1 isoform X2 n=1 Tax=Jatropha curcas TaxID=180498 RepID=UPI0005FAABDF|nr:DNA-binding protein RHL1 isoform X2 [Jatropha curcas]
MVKASAASSSKKNSEPDVLERKRLKKLALSNNLLSETPAKTYSPLAPSKTVLKHHGKDILRKSQRKNRFLFSFPGLLAPIASGGKIGELKDLGTKNPILYLHFPQLFGTIVYPKNRYLTMQFSRGGKNVMCEDNFDSMIVFSEAWWIGTQEENPEEARLDFPKQLIEGQGPQVECDFKGGAGAMSAIKQAVNRSATKYEEKSPETEPENYSSDDKNNLKALEGTTPIQHSERTARKTFKSTDVSSGDDSVESVAAEEGGEEKKVKSPPGSTIVLDLDNEGSIGGNHLSPQIQAHAMSETKSKRVSESAVLAATSNENSHSNRGSLVQATISTLFNKARGKKKVEEKNEPRNSRISSSSKRKIDQAGGPRKRGKLTEGKKAGTGIKEKKEIYEVEDDDIEEFSSSTQEDTEGSDEDWEA